MTKANYLKTLLLIFALLLSATVAAHDFEVNGIYYNINGNEATVTYKGTSYSQYSNEYSGNISIPATVSYNGTLFSVTTIGEYAFSECRYLASINIPNSVTSIDKSAFYNCRGLTSITIPNSVTSIGKNAFCICSGLTSIVIPNSVTFIGDEAFEYCTGLTNVIIGNSVISIGNSAFEYCTGLTSIIIPNSVTSIGYGVFSKCDNLTRIIVESGNAIFDSRDNCNAIIKTFSNTLIAGCKNTIIPNSVTSIDGYAFSQCSGLTSILIPNSVTTIGDAAFQSCSMLTSIVIPTSVASIGKHAFMNCIGLTSIVIPNSVTFIGDGAFVNCPGLTSIIVESGNAIFDSRDNCNAIIRTSSNTLIAGCKNTVIPNSVTRVGNMAFEYCTELTSIVIPNSVTSIGAGAFGACTSLKSITIPNSVTSIGAGAFSACTVLTSIVIPNSVTSIGDLAFSACFALTRVDIGNSMITIGDKAFSNCTGLKYVYCYSSIPPSCLDNCFPDYSATLHVPAASLANYFTAVCWKNFENIVGDAVYPIEISINNDSVELQLTDQIKLTATVTPVNASNKEITWISTDTMVATVNDGMVLAVGCGECNIIASCFGMQVMCHVLVANRISLDQQEAMLLPNHILTLTPTPIVPGDYIVSSSDPTVAAARVVSGGRIQVVGIKEGTTAITVGSVDGSAIPATCLVTVYTENGDLNSDGFVNISDVTSLINYLLSGDDSQLTIKNADINDDGDINITDVTALINSLLNGTT